MAPGGGVNEPVWGTSDELRSFVNDDAGTTAPGVTIRGCGMRVPAPPQAPTQQEDR